MNEVGTWQSGATPSRGVKAYFGGTIPWLKTGDLNDDYVRDIPERITEKALEETSVKLNPEGSVLIAMYGATIGKVGILTYPATTNQACCACSEFIGINNKYLFFFLISHKDAFLMQAGGGAQPNISKEIIINTLAPVPPLKEQERIVQEIEKWFSVLYGIENNEKTIKGCVETCKSQILDLAIHGKLVLQDPKDEPAIELLKRINPDFKPSDNLHYEGSLPKGWCPVTYNDIAEYINGRAFKPEEWKNKGKPIIRIQNLNDVSAPFNYSGELYEEKFRICQGDLLFAWAASLGVYIWKREDAWLNQHIFKVIPRPVIEKDFLYYALSASINSFYQKSHGSGMVHITKNAFLSSTLLLPPIQEQRRIVTAIKNIFSCLDDLLHRVTS